MMSPPTIIKDLVLLGGGHSHAIALRQWGMAPIPGVRLTLITEASNTPYSGMVPGHVAGIYSYEDCHIDLRPLARFAQAQLVIDRVVGLDLDHNRVLCANHPPVSFDVLSIDTGSTPRIPPQLEDRDYIVPAKPIRQLLERWNQILDQVKQQHDRPLTMAIVGGGVGGVELMLAMQRQLQTLVDPTQLTFHLFHRDDQLLTGHNHCVRRRVHDLLLERGVQVHLQATVDRVEERQIYCQSGLTVACDYLFWVTQADAPDWIRHSGLAVDSQGFIQVQDTLQSCSHPQVFAAGDIATMVNHPRPKAGVFAVRQGKPLVQNLQNTLLGRSLTPYVPQRQYLSLIGTGDGGAIASRGWLYAESPLLWRWKDTIDRAFMERFRELPPMSTGSTQAVPAPMYCSGCGAKVGSATLERVLHRISQEQPPLTQREDILIGLQSPDDAAIVQVPPGQAMVHTLDYFPALINDPYVFGQISANHALSDLFAMGARPQSALAIATLPYGLATKQEETLYQVLSGAVRVLHQAQAPLIGGHTTEGPELVFGLACNGLVRPDQILRKGGMQPGQALILTKALGVGTLFASEMQGQAQGRWIDGAIASMVQSNQAAATGLIQHQASACTDITGFGLLGHLWEMVRDSAIAVELDLTAMPILEGARTTIQRGIVSSLHPQNLQRSSSILNLTEVKDHPDYPLLFDPQTSGGLLATVPIDQAAACLEALWQAGYHQAQQIGVTQPLTPGTAPIKIKL